MNEDLIQSMTAMGNTAAFSTAQPKKSSSISMDDFLKILAASMSNPSFSGDSSGGGGGTDYISQLVQFTSLEQMNEISETLTMSVMMNQQQQAFSLMGKQVTIMDNGNKITGIVEKVRFTNGFATIVVNGKEYTMGAIQEVGNSPSGPEEENEEAGNEEQ